MLACFLLFWLPAKDPTVQSYELKHKTTKFTELRSESIFGHIDILSLASLVSYTFPIARLSILSEEDTIFPDNINK